MNPAAHYARAEELLQRVDEATDNNWLHEWGPLLIAQAAVHASLAGIPAPISHRAGQR